MIAYYGGWEIYSISLRIANYIIGMINVILVAIYIARWVDSI